MTECSILEAFAENTDGCHGIVLKHFPEDAVKDDVLVYLKIICKTEVKYVCFPAANRDVAIVILNDIVFDTKVQKWQQKAFSSTDFQGCYPLLEVLGKPTGVFVTGVPDRVTEEQLRMYFKRQITDGIEDSVEGKIERVAYGACRYAIVPITSYQALESILSKKSQKIAGTDIRVEPFYENVHRHILDKLKYQETQKRNAGSSNTMFSCIQHEVMQDTHPTDFNTNEEVINEQPQQAEDQSYVTMYGSPVTENSQGQFVILDDGWKRQGRNVATVKPVVRNTNVFVVEPAHDNSEQKTLHRPSALVYEDEIPLPRYKIELLKAFRFQIKFESEDLRITFEETEEKVVFKASSFDELKLTKLQMFECLDEVIVRAKTFPDQKYKFLSRKQCLNSFQEKCKVENIKVVFENDNERNEIRCHSFSEKEATKGIQLLEEEVTTIVIRVKLGQLELPNSELSSVMASLDTGVTTVYLEETEGCIYIMSMRDGDATKANRTIIQHLKVGDECSKKLAKVTLESAKARCFQAHLENKLRQELIKSHGKLVVVQQSKYPLVLKISAEGGDDAVRVMKKAIEQIWHESVDLNVVSKTDGDKMLLMKGLCGDSGKDFINEFEQKHDCFIELVKNGNFSNLKTRVEVEDINDSSEDESFEGSSISGGAECDTKCFGPKLDKVETFEAFMEGDKSQKKWKVKNSFLQFQREMDEDEALELAKACSLQSDRNKSSVIQTFSQTRSVNIFGTKVKLMQGAVAKQRADVLVNVVSASRSFSEGSVSSSFLEMGGEKLSQMYEKARPSPSGVVVTTESCGQLKCSTVFHVQLQKTECCEKIVRRAVSDVLAECKTWGFETVAFPALGVGRMFRFRPEMVADIMISECYNQLQTRQHNIKQVSFVVYDREVYDKFESAFEAFFPISDKREKALVKKSLDATFKSETGVAVCKELPPSGARHRERAPSGQANSRRHSGGSRSENRGPHNRGARSFPSPLSQTRGSYEKDNKSQIKSDTMTGKAGRRLGYHESKPDLDLTIKVIAETKEKCIKARNTFGEMLQERFLYEESVDKKQTISKESKQKIARIIATHNIQSIRCKDRYILKGEKESVHKAHVNILKVLLSDKDNLEIMRKRKAHTKRETKEFVEFMAKYEPEVPCYWKNYKQGETLKTLLLSAKQFFTQKKFESVEVMKESKTFSCIVRMVNATFDYNMVGKGNDAAGLDRFRYQKLYILKIERIENLQLYDEYAKRRHELYRRLYASGDKRFPKLEQIKNGCKEVATSRHICDEKADLAKDNYTEINEYFLFHGTKECYVKKICNDGLDSRVGSENAMFGPGIYAAECTTKADQYADDKTCRSAGHNNPKTMFLIRMMLGNSFICTNPNPIKFRKPPCTTCYKHNCYNGRHTNSFDSVVGDNQKLFREFVVYDRSLCYPEYLITYERR